MDQTTDLSGQQLYYFSRVCPTPDFVKQASTADLCGEPDKIAPEFYADPVSRFFPCHTPAATWTSRLFFEEKAAQVDPRIRPAVEDRLTYFIKAYGIGNEIQEALTKLAASKLPPELADEDYALVIKTASGETQRHYPLRNGEEVKAAASYLQQYYNHMPFNLRRDMAERVLQKAASKGYTLGEHKDWLERQAGYGACKAADCAELILDRVRVARALSKPSTAMQVEMLKMAQVIVEQPHCIHEPGRLCKVASVIDDFDRCHSLREYSEGFPRLEDVLFGVNLTKAASIVKQHCETVTGSVYKLADLSKLRVSKMREYLGDDVADALTSDGLHIDTEKAAELIPTLPRHDATLLDELLQEVGVTPMAKQADARGKQLSHDYLTKLAEDYRRAGLAAANSNR